MPVINHLVEGDYEVNFPDGVDTFPTVYDESVYMDAWIFNKAFAAIGALQGWIIDHADLFDAEEMDDFVGEEGALELAIPPGLYKNYKFGMAWDSNLLEENIRSGVAIFGVVGTLASGGGGMEVSLPALSVLEGAWVYIAPPGLSMTAAVPSVGTPAVSAE